jgi:hypothetical protein
LPSPSRILKIVRNVLLMMAALVAAFLLIVVPWFFTAMITHNQYHYPDPNDGKTPKSYHLDFCWIEFHLTGWNSLEGLVHSSRRDTARGTIIYCHGLNRTRTEMLPDAVFGHSLGYNGVLFDLRHQGMSGGDHHDLGLPGAIGREGGSALRRRAAAGGAARGGVGCLDGRRLRPAGGGRVAGYLRGDFR